MLVDIMISVLVVRVMFSYVSFRLETNTWPLGVRTLSQVLSSFGFSLFGKKGTFFSMACRLSLTFYAPCCVQHLYSARKNAWGTGQPVQTITLKTDWELEGYSKRAKWWSKFHILPIAAFNTGVKLAIVSRNKALLFISKLALHYAEGNFMAHTVMISRASV